MMCDKCNGTGEVTHPEGGPQYECSDCVGFRRVLLDVAQMLEASDVYTRSYVIQTARRGAQSPFVRGESNIEKGALSNRQRELDASVTSEQAAIGVARERKAMDDRESYKHMTTAEACRRQGDGFLNDYD